MTKPRASSPAVRRRMQRTPRRDTPAEMEIRRRLHSKGYRYRVDAKPLPFVGRRADVVFRSRRVAIFVDGCFWHGCRKHGTWPKENAAFWRDKIRENIRRDHDTDSRLRAAGWAVLRVWEHEDPDVAVERIEKMLESRFGNA